MSDPIVCTATIIILNCVLLNNTSFVDNIEVYVGWSIDQFIVVLSKINKKLKANAFSTPFLTKNRSQKTFITGNFFKF